MTVLRVVIPKDVNKKVPLFMSYFSQFPVEILVQSQKKFESVKKRGKKDG